MAILGTNKWPFTNPLEISDHDFGLPLTILLGVLVFELSAPCDFNKLPSYPLRLLTSEIGTNAQKLPTLSAAVAHRRNQTR